MVEVYDKETFEKALKMRQVLGPPKELLDSNVVIFHCPLDLAFIDMLDKPSIFYNHRTGRPTTFMFHEITKLVEPIHREILIRDRDWCNQKLKELYKKPDVLLTNSRFTQGMFVKYFEMKPFVCYPPVDLGCFQPTSHPSRSYFLSAQRVNWQKRLVLQIKAFAGLKERLVIVGGRRDHRPNEDVKQLAEEHENITFMGPVSDEELVDLYSNAKAVIQTGWHEDFGLVPIEGFACGTPAIVVDEGGFRETVHSAELGIRIRPPYVENLRETVQRFDMRMYDTAILRKEAERYRFDRFKHEMTGYVELAVERHGNRL